MQILSQWLRDQRASRNLQVVELANLTRVDATTISRIENQKSDPFIDTVIRLCDGLKFPISELWGLLDPIPGRDLPVAARNSVNEKYLTLDDVLFFVRMNRSNEPAAAALFGHLFAIVVNQPSDLFFSHSYNQLNQDSPVFEFEINYPKDISAKKLYAAFEAGGFLMPKDAGIYLRHCRLEANLNLEDLGSMVKLAPPILSRMETSNISRLKLIDVINLTKSLGRPEIFAMYWEVFSQLDSLIFSPENSNQLSYPVDQNELKLVFSLTTLFRWWQHGRSDNFFLIDMLRRASS